MNSYLKLGVAAWIAPALTLAAVGVAVWLAVPAFLLGLALGLGGLAGWLLYGAGGAFVRGYRRRFSPVRRRGPMPAAWRQWR
jgi:hypothetical protein